MDGDWSFHLFMLEARIDTDDLAGQFSKGIPS